MLRVYRFAPGVVDHCRSSESRGAGHWPPTADGAVHGMVSNADKLPGKERCLFGSRPGQTNAAGLVPIPWMTTLVPERL